MDQVAPETAITLHRSLIGFATSLG
jgi:hypothetical protein